jgi:hypothetical protein
MLKRSDANTLAVRNAGDSADRDLTARNVTASGTLNVTGNTTLGGTLTITGGTTFPAATAATALMGPATSASGAAPSSAAPTQRALDATDLPVFANNIRVSLDSTNPLVTGLGQTLYAHPYKGNQITLYNTTQSKWITQTFSTVNIAVPNTTGTNYDLYAYSTGNTTIALEVQAAGSNTNLNGRWVRTGDNSRLLIATFRSGMTGSGAGWTGNNGKQFFLANAYNTITLPIQTQLATGAINTTSYTYASTAFREAGGVGAADDNQLQFVVLSAGSTVEPPHVGFTAVASHSAATPAPIQIALGHNGSTQYEICQADTAAITDKVNLTVQTNTIRSGSNVYNYIQALEAAAGATTTFYTGSFSAGPSDCTSYFFGNVPGR